MPRPIENTRDIHEDLKNYRRYKSELRKIDAKLDKLKDVDMVESCANEQFRKQVRRVYGLPPTSEVKKLKAQRKTLWYITAMTEQWVSMLEDCVVREIFRQKFLEGDCKPTYSDVAAALGIRIKPESVRKMISRTIKKYSKAP